MVENMEQYKGQCSQKPKERVIRYEHEQLEKVLAALCDNRKSLGWVPQSMKRYQM